MKKIISKVDSLGEIWASKDKYSRREDIQSNGIFIIFKAEEFTS